MKFTRNERELQTRIKTPVRVIGLTGGIASGKTVATTALKKAGYTVIDADEVSRKLFGTKTDGEKSIARTFPQAVKNGTLDRTLLRRIISTDAKARKTLNELTHPKIVEHIKSLISKTPPPIILSAPLLFETGLCSLCDVTVCVYCPKPVRIKRLMTRDGMTKQDAERLIDAQIPDTERCTIADYIVPNDKKEFVEEILELIEQIVR